MKHLVPVALIAASVVCVVTAHPEAAVWFGLGFIFHMQLHVMTARARAGPPGATRLPSRQA